MEDFSLIETMRWDPSKGYFLLERHLERLLHSAQHFAFSLDLEKVKMALTKFSEDLSMGKIYRVRMLLGKDGSIDISASVLSPELEPVYFDLSEIAVDSQNLFLYHKTTHRPLYIQEYQKAKSMGLFDCIFVNERGELTEGAISNIFLEIDGRLITPPVDSGLLNGTLRQDLLEQGKAEEGVLYPIDLGSAHAIYLGNSVRGPLRACYRGMSPPGFNSTN